MADSELVTPPSDRLQPKKFNMGTSEQSAVPGDTHKGPPMAPCLRCTRAVELDPAKMRRCSNCGGHFHLSCLSGSSASLAAEHTALYRCRLCRVSDPLGPDALTRMHALLESCDEKLADVLAFAFQRSRLLESEANDLRSKLATLELHRNTAPMDQASTAAAGAEQQSSETQPAKKRALLFGDASVKKIRSPLRAQLSSHHQLAVLNLQNRSCREMIEEAKANILKHTDSQTGVFFHPGPGDCLQLEGRELISAITDFADWLRSEGRDTQLTVYSVPVLHDECRLANEQLKILAGTGKIRYQALTRVQQPMMIKASQVYDDEIAATVAKVAARNVSSFLGLPQVRRPVSKEKPPPRSPKDNKRTERQGSKPVPAVSVVSQVPPEMPRLCQYLEKAFLRLEALERRSPAEHQSGPRQRQRYRQGPDRRGDRFDRGPRPRNT